MEERSRLAGAASAQGLAQAVDAAVEVAAGLRRRWLARALRRRRPARAREWFISSFPLLGALAAAFTLVEDPQVCQRLEISRRRRGRRGAGDLHQPGRRADEEECRFVIAHELLHVGLRHQARRRGRDPYLWNVACDYVINGWLVEMGVGELPQLGRALRSAS